ncbi:MAG: hypothetical protein WCP21_22360, partial [Armatimonadota bacterium]
MTDYSNAIRKLLRLSLFGFIVVALVLGYWQVVMGPRLSEDKYNQRQQLQLQRIAPGTIRTADGVIILDRQKAAGDKGGWEAVYPAGRDFAHLTGYAPSNGLQRGLRDALYGLGEFANPWEDLLRGEPRGNNIT